MTAVLEGDVLLQLCWLRGITTINLAVCWPLEGTSKAKCVRFKRMQIAAMSQSLVRHSPLLCGTKPLWLDFIFV